MKYIINNFKRKKSNRFFLFGIIIILIALILCIFLKYSYVQKIASKIIRLRLYLEFNETKELFQEAFNKSNDIFLIASPEGEIIEHNNAFLTFYSTESQEVRWIKMLDLFNDSEKWDNMVAKCTEYCSQRFDNVHFKDFLHLSKYASLNMRLLKSGKILVIIKFLLNIF